MNEKASEKTYPQQVNDVPSPQDGNGKQSGRPPNSKAKTDERREQVYSLSLRGAKKAALARMYDVHVNTITRDLKAMKKRLRSDTVTADAWTEIAESLKFLDEIEKLALYEFYQNKSNPSAKQKFLETCIKAREAKVRLQLNVGHIPKVADKVQEDIFIYNGVDIRTMSTEELQKKRDELASRMTTLGGESIEGNGNPELN